MATAQGKQSPSIATMLDAVKWGNHMALVGSLALAYTGVGPSSTVDLFVLQNVTSAYLPLVTDVVVPANQVVAVWRV